jgi:hypothetical protein
MPELISRTPQDRDSLDHGSSALKLARSLSPDGQGRLCEPYG